MRFQALGKHAGLAVLVGSVIAALAFLHGWRTHHLKGGEEFGVDVFYHVTMADGGALFCMRRTFPHTTQSIWRDHFYDKEFLFHLYLGAVREWERLIRGRDAPPPFEVGYLAVAALIIAVFAFVLYKVDDRYGFIWMLAFVLLSPGFRNRLSMLRPHHFSIALMTLAAFFFIRMKDGPKELWKPVLLTFLFVYSYSNPHFILIPAAMAAAFFLLEGKAKKAAALFGAALFSLVLFMTAHPQFPNTFICWKVQCVDVITRILEGGGDTGIASELVAPSRSWKLYNAGVFALWVWNAVLFAYLLRRRTLGRESAFYFSLATLFFVGLFFSVRSVEYAFPFALLCSASLCRDLDKAGVFETWQIYAVAALLLVGLPLATFGWSSKLRLTPKCEFSGFGVWAKRHLPPGAVVANIGWGDFTRLFHAAPHCRYLVGLDPMFGFAANPELASKMRAFHKGEYIISPREMRVITGADFAFVGAADHSERRRAYVMAKYLSYRPVYHGSDGTLFILPAAARRLPPPRKKSGISPSRDPSPPQP